jgi:hypothetical protein
MYKIPFSTMRALVRVGRISKKENLLKDGTGWR